MTASTFQAMRNRMRRLNAVTETQRLRVAALLERARSTRAMIQRQVLADPARRVARASRGGSDGVPLESRQRRCPYCGSEAARLGGDVRAVGGLVKSELACEACGRIFVFVRRVIGVDDR